MPAPSPPSLTRGRRGRGGRPVPRHQPRGGDGSGNVILEGARRHGLPAALALPAKVLSCAPGRNHLGLLDEFGRLFMQGCNRYGQLGTGDWLRPKAPTQVPRWASSLCASRHCLYLLCGHDVERTPGYREPPDHREPPQ